MVNNKAIGDTRMTKVKGTRTIRIRESSLSNLRIIGKMGESYNDVIDRLISKELLAC